MVFLVVGASGVGKSALCKAAASQLCNVLHVDLDNSIDSSLKDGSHWPQFFDDCLKKIEVLEKKYEKSEEVVLCDVGSGIMEAPEAFSYLQSKSKVISIFDEPSSVFERVKQRPGGYWSLKTVAEYQQQYALRWEKWFIKSKLKFSVVNLSEKEAQAGFIEFLKKRIPGIAGTGS